MSEADRRRSRFGGAIGRGVFATVISQFIRGADPLPPRFLPGSTGERIGQGVIAQLFGRRIPPAPTVGAGPSPVDRDLYGLPSSTASTIQRERDAKRLADLNRIFRASPQARVFEWLRGQLRGRKRGKAKGRRGLKWRWVNGKWVQFGRGLLRGGAWSVAATAILNLPRPLPPVFRNLPQARAFEWTRDRAIGAVQRARGPAPGAGGGGSTAARGRQAAPTALPGGATSRSSSSSTAGGVLREVRVTARRVPVPVVAPPPTRLQQLLKLAPALVPLLLPGKDKDRARAVASITGVGQGMTQPVAQFYPFPLTAVGSPGVGSGGCPAGCRPEPKKRKPRKRRDVCYQGTYTETASGLRKTKRRKVPCR